MQQKTDLADVGGKAAATLARGFVSASIGLAFGDTQVIHKKPETNALAFLSLPNAPSQTPADELTVEQQEKAAAVIAAAQEKGLVCDPGDAAVYLQMNDWDVQLSIEEALGDLEWESKETQKQQSQVRIGQRQDTILAFEKTALLSHDKDQ
jgi:hypothetical protein